MKLHRNKSNCRIESKSETRVRNFRNRIFMLCSIYLLVSICLFTTGAGFSSCTHDEPNQGNSSHRPDNNRPDNPDNPNGGNNPNNPGGGEDPDKPGGGENPGNSDDSEEASEICGEWKEIDTSYKLKFTANGYYYAYLYKNNDYLLDKTGKYQYFDTSRFLLINVTEGNEMRNEEYRCLIDGNSMTLYGTDNRRHEYTRINN